MENGPFEDVPPPKTNMTMENPPFEDVFPLGFPMFSGVRFLSKTSFEQSNLSALNVSIFRCLKNHRCSRAFWGLFKHCESLFNDFQVDFALFFFQFGLG